MKISRKVGRRSRSSVSRRRLRNKKSYKKNSYRKKHTQRGGKRGKHGRGHKRMRTYKHGKKFHRGGKDMPIFGSPDPASFDKSTKTIKNLRYIKVTGKVPKEKYDNFDIKITKDKDIDIYTITFTKTGGDSRFSFSIGPYSKQDFQGEVAAAIEHGRTLTNVTYDDGSKPTDDVTYMFKEDLDLAITMRDYIYDQSLSELSRGVST
jgi:hypothetical protein